MVGGFFIAYWNVEILKPIEKNQYGSKYYDIIFSKVKDQARLNSTFFVLSNAFPFSQQPLDPSLPPSNCSPPFLPSSSICDVKTPDRTPDHATSLLPSFSPLKFTSSSSSSRPRQPAERTCSQLLVLGRSSVCPSIPPSSVQSFVRFGLACPRWLCGPPSIHPSALPPLPLSGHSTLGWRRLSLPPTLGLPPALRSNHAAGRHARRGRSVGRGNCSTGFGLLLVCPPFSLSSPCS